MIVIFDLDGDSAIHDPLTLKKYDSNFGVYVLNVTDKKTFIDNLLANKFGLSLKVYSAILYFTESGYGQELLDLIDGNYDFGNYNIQIYSNIVNV